MIRRRLRRGFGGSSGGNAPGSTPAGGTIGANGSGSSSTWTPPRLQIPSLSATHDPSCGNANCVSPLKQCAAYIQTFAEPPIEAKRAAMPPSALRRALALLIAFAGFAAGCERRPEGAVKVVVIGETPKIVDPAAGPLTAGEAVLLTSVAQGLVRFDARGQIEPGLAERWNVSDDGLSYVFRLTAGKWPDGRTVQARDVARLLTRQLRPASRNPAKDSLGAVQEVVAMTDRVLEIRLLAP